MVAAHCPCTCVIPAANAAALVVQCCENFVAFPTPPDTTRPVPPCPRPAGRRPCWQRSPSHWWLLFWMRKGVCLHPARHPRGSRPWLQQVAGHKVRGSGWCKVGRGGALLLQADGCKVHSEGQTLEQREGGACWPRGGRTAPGAMYNSTVAKRFYGPSQLSGCVHAACCKASCLSDRDAATATLTAYCPLARCCLLADLPRSRALQEAFSSLLVF